MTPRFLSVAFLILSWFSVYTQVPEPIHLPNGWKLTPAGKSLTLGDLPLNICISPDKKLAAIANNGQSHQSIQLIDLDKQLLLDTKTIGKSWLGLAFSSNGRVLYASGGNDNWILRYDISQNKLILRDTLFLGNPWPERISPAGIAIDDSRNRLYVVTKEDNSLYILDVATKKLVTKVKLEGEAYTCLLSPNRQTLYISCWGCDQVYAFDTKTLKVKTRIKVGDNPNDMALTSNGRFLFVANANDNSVSVVDLKSNKVVEVLNAALYPDSPPGSTTNSLALGDNDRSLFIANADNNCLAVFDVTLPGKSKSRGFIPTGWYPTCVRAAGNELLVANGKGFTSMANPWGPNPIKKDQAVNWQKDAARPAEVQYIGGLFKGALSFISIPDEKSMGIFSQAVYANTPYKKDSTGSWPGPIPSGHAQTSPIKHVFYIVKENRTYDQVLGDVPAGNGDSSLVLFGKKTTPNQHALTREFVLFDNFYVNGEVSADGHSWSLGAYATDYLEKTWPTSYGDRGGDYDGEGNRKIANNKSFIWDQCKKGGLSYRTYGEFADQHKANIPVLDGHFCKTYTGWDQSVMDTTRFRQWKNDFDSLMSIQQVPRLNTLHFINDHTEGLKLGRPTPQAAVADNDYAVGLFVEYLSRSKIWNESVVFILEDDAQNGPDHVDAHRSTLYVAGGYVKRNFVDHTLYSTASVLRTMELILGLPPMSQYDAAAEPLWRSFSASPDSRPFNSIPNQISLFDRNVAMNDWQRKSERFDFKKEDKVPDDDFNRVIWYAVKGDLPYPNPRRAAFVQVENTPGDD